MRSAFDLESKTTAGEKKFTVLQPHLDSRTTRLVDKVSMGIDGILNTGQQVRENQVAGRVQSCDGNCMLNLAFP